MTSSTQPSGIEQMLPTYHLRPRYGWLNDPNGVVRRGERWHVFYQHNSSGPFHAAIEWGHASSSDLLTWREHPVAFRPTPGGPDAFGCWSGVALTGLDRPAVVYSGVVDESYQSTIVLRWGSDDLDTWEEPVVVGRTPTTDDIAVMRDPFVFGWNERRWALLGAGRGDGTPCLLVYSCDDILSWRYEGVFLDGADELLTQGAPAQIWECPQIITSSGDEPDLVVVSLWKDNVLGDVVGVTGTMVDAGGYPALRPTGVEPIDTGDSFYAPQVALDPGTDTGGALMFGWVRQDGLPVETHLVAGCLTLPRRISLRGGRVRVTADPSVNGLEIGEARVVEPGRHVLPNAVVLDIGAGEAGTVLTGSVLGHDEPVVVPLRPGDRAFLDAGVLELYPADAVPATHRAEPGTWLLEASAPTPLREVLTHSLP